MHALGGDMARDAPMIARLRRAGSSRSADGPLAPSAASIGRSCPSSSRFDAPGPGPAGGVRVCRWPRGQDQHPARRAAGMTVRPIRLEGRAQGRGDARIVAHPQVLAVSVKGRPGHVCGADLAIVTRNYIFGMIEDMAAGKAWRGVVTTAPVARRGASSPRGLCPYGCRE